MTNHKFKLGEEVEVDGRKLHRIVSLQDFNDVKQGDIGGLIEDEAMLDVSDNSWVYGNSYVAGEGSFITGNSEIYDSAKVDASVIANSTVRNGSEVTNSTIKDSYVHKASQVHDSKLEGSYLSHDTQVRNSSLTQTSLEAAYVQDVELMGIDEAHIVQIGDNLTRMDMIDSAELGNYDESNIEEYVAKYKAEAIELSDDDLSDLNEPEHMIHQ